MATVVSYNSIVFDVVSLGEWTREVVMDGNTYLYHRHAIPVTAVYSPMAVSYTNTNNVLANAQGQLAPTTDVAIRHLLSQPRKQLSITIGGVQVLYSPQIIAATQRTVDANNGPIIREIDIQEVIGSKTFIIRFVATTCISECAAGETPMVLSHLFSMSDEISLPEYLTTRTIRGHAILRTDMLNNPTFNTPYVPDDFRAALLHPVPPNMQRQDVQISVNEEGNRLDYVITDQEKHYNINPNAALGIVDIQCFHSAEIGKPSIEDALIALGRPVVSAVGRIGGAIAANSGVPVVSQAHILGGAALVAYGAYMELALTVANLMPKQTHTLTVRVHGDRRADRKRLEATALSIAWRRLIGTAVAPAGRLSHIASGWYLNVLHDVCGKYVEVVLRGRGSVINNTIYHGINLNRRLRDVIRRDSTSTELASLVTTLAQTFGVALDENIMPAEGSIPFILDQQRGWRNPQPASADVDQRSNNLSASVANRGARGTFVYKLAAQVLHDACTGYSLPTTPPVAKDDVLTT